jgi:serine/threonine-protein kinase
LPPPASPAPQATPPTVLAAPPAAAGASGERALVETAATVALQASTGERPSGSMLLRRFQIARTIGRGGMGAVYLADDRQLGEQVALKVMAQNLAEDPQAAERFRREVGAARKITHPNVIRIHDLGDDAGLLFLTMEYCPSQTLEALLRERGRLELAEARPLIGAICDALDAAHAAGVVHRDLKPLNVLVNPERQVRVIDFGLAKASYLAGATATGMILGTPEYMAPEQVRGQPVDHRTDLYALAALTFRMLCGRTPFRADTPIAVGFMQCSQAPPAPSSLAPGLPAGIEETILKGLSKDPAQRFDSAAAFKRAMC